MATVELTDEQVIDLVLQLSSEQRARILRDLIVRHWDSWEGLSRLGGDRIRSVATQRGLNWDAMTEDEREAFVDGLVHEDRACPS